MITVEEFDRDIHGEEISKICLRDIDELEARAMYPYFNIYPEGYIVLHVASDALAAYVVKIDGKIQAVFGLTDGFSDGVAIPWMVGTDKLYYYPKTLVVMFKQWLELFESCGFTRFYNYVSCNNTKALKLLLKCGFTVDYAHTYYFSDVPFFEIIKERQD